MEKNYDVFISHSSNDKNVADAIVAGLESEGIRCWIAPRDILPGFSWARAIVHGVNSSKMMVLIFSSNVKSSEYVMDELSLASSSKMPIIPFRIEDISPEGDFKFYLNRKHWLDALTPDLEKHIEELKDVVKTIFLSNAKQNIEYNGIEEKQKNKTKKEVKNNSNKFLVLVAILLLASILIIYKLLYSKNEIKTIQQKTTIKNINVNKTKEIKSKIIAKEKKQLCTDKNATKCYTIANQFYKKSNYKDAFIYYHKACKANNAAACFKEGKLYQEGKGIQKDYKQAIELYNKACNGDNMKGCTNLGLIYAEALGVNRNYKKAKKLFKKACNGNAMKGCNNLGYMYYKALGVKQDFQKAKILFKKACDNGEMDGCDNLLDINIHINNNAKKLYPPGFFKNSLEW